MRLKMSPFVHFFSVARPVLATFGCLFVATSCSFAEEGANDTKFEFVQVSNLRFSSVSATKGISEGSKLKSLAKKENQEAEFYWFQYGDASSRTVGIKFDPDEPNILCVDTDRDQQFSDSEKFTSDDSENWLVDIRAEYGVQQATTSTQKVRISRINGQSSFTIATAGIREGKADFNGTLRDAIIEDRNANGLWFDAEDRLFIDFDGNGKISRLRERVPCHGIRKIRGELYSISGSAAGESISLSLVTETGTLVPTIKLLDESATITSVSGQLGSSTGIGISIDEINEPLKVPIGDWHVENLNIEIKANDGVFQFVFARLGTKNLVSVGDKEEKSLELVGELELGAGVSAQHQDGKVHLTINPSLVTESDCYLVGSKTGNHSAVNENRLNAFSHDLQRELDVGSSGFS